MTLFLIFVLVSYVVFEIDIAVQMSLACQLCTPTQCGPGIQDPHRSRVAFLGDPLDRASQLGALKDVYLNHRCEVCAHELCTGKPYLDRRTLGGNTGERTLCS